MSHLIVIILLMIFTSIMLDSLWWVIGFILVFQVTHFMAIVKLIGHYNEMKEEKEEDSEDSLKQLIKELERLRNED